ncbi:SRPBCC family protein [Jiangella rhizosphaerae]|uniref:SRPBCC domain-containing protein n=1 Tax=Jiangella rhizosphaerae TaxID=2293569 RepID=A0A418KP60_9ACTN|nr:SRPBCC domain-containing protein [Jiangella rhizosphaerae]RIQ20928.1 SRPBCC domain-containing protein [Jiangella rhizosphaerae]
MVESSTPDAATAVVSVVVDADPDDVFPMFTEPRRLSGWFWPAAFAAIYETDARPGGRFTFRTAGLAAGHNIAIRGLFGEIRPPRLITYIWSWDGDSAPASRVAVRLAPSDQGGTEVVVTHSHNPTEEQRDDHLKGWHDSLSRLADHLAIG